ncbi:hypothetical protein Rhopal_005331-T1 [Rhodotorula paludigena]|uniref:FUN14 family-domain-containing protein n=1 Tax=Rhodotorula paludigena TaxID=86838 RepID=A0AAV5GI46_9BASI|nr:hypothetical protein Rhopal_005331-T1 [Rhodotorula paludigena]
MTTSSSASFLHSYRLALGLSLPLGALAYSTLLQPGSALQCASASDRSYADKPAFSLPDASAAEAAAAGKRDAAGTGGKGGPEAESILNLRDLGFGTVSGICVGVFVKKGLRAAAFTLGFVFIGLQYLSSRQFINVNWGAFSSSYDRFITSRAGPPSSQGGNRLARVWTGFIDFVSANVQQRATFVAGVVLGLRLG